MKKYLLLVMGLFVFVNSILAQNKVEKQVPTSKTTHLTFGLQNNDFYFQKGSDTTKQKIVQLDTASIAKIIDAAITENKVAPKNLNVILQGDDLLLHPQFDLLIDTILRKTVSEVRIQTNVFE